MNEYKNIRLNDSSPVFQSFTPIIHSFIRLFYTVELVSQIHSLSLYKFPRFNMKSTIILALASIAIAAPTRTIENRQLPGFGSGSGTSSGLDALKSIFPGLSGSGSGSGTPTGSGLDAWKSLIPGLSGSGSGSDSSSGSGLAGLKSLLPGRSTSSSGSGLSIPGLSKIPYQATPVSETPMLKVNPQAQAQAQALQPRTASPRMTAARSTRSSLRAELPRLVTWARSLDPPSPSS